MEEQYYACTHKKNIEQHPTYVRGGTGGLKRIIAVRELYRLILKGWSLVSLWHLSGDWNTTTPLLVCYGDIYTGGGEKPSILGKSWSIGSGPVVVQTGIAFPSRIVIK